MKIEYQPYQPRTQQEFWCTICDNNKVHSEKPESGNFYLQFGHQFNQATTEYDGEYVGVMFAVCPQCEK